MIRTRITAALASTALAGALALSAAAPASAAPAFGRPVEGVVWAKSRTSGCNGLLLGGTWTSQWVCVSRYDYAGTSWMSFFRGLAR